MTVRFGDWDVDWLGYATTRIAVPDSPTIYLDPGRYGVLDGYDAQDGDLICVTHDHHYDSDGIHRVAREDATVLVYEGVDATRIGRDVEPPADLPYDVVRVGETDDLVVGDVVVRTIEAYNEHDGPHTHEDGTPHHPKGFGVGFWLDVAGRSVLWPGDSDALDGHRTLDVDLFVPPIGGSFTMDRHEAAALADDLDPALVLPVHYDTFEALETDARAFAADVADAGVPVVLEHPEQET